MDMAQCPHASCAMTHRVVIKLGKRCMATINASIPVLTWAAQREHLVEGELIERFPKWEGWIRGNSHPTLKQLEQFARLTHTPIGYFFLPEPPELTLPVPDFRTVGSTAVREPSTATCWTPSISVSSGKTGIRTTLALTGWTGCRLWVASACKTAPTTLLARCGKCLECPPRSDATCRRGRTPCANWSGRPKAWT